MSDILPLLVRGLLLLELFCARGIGAAADTAFRFNESRGEFTVGFRVVQQYDETRVYLGSSDPSTGEAVTAHRARPVQTLIWYPAAETHASNVTYADYLLLAGSEDNFDRSAKQIRTTAEFRLRDYISAEMVAATVDAIKRQPMWATRDAAPIAGAFPVVIYAPSHNASATENADLCEYLASHGYVVLASTSMAANGRWMLTDLGDVEAQVGDIEFLVGYASTLADADANHIAVIGYSWGGIANVFAAAKDNRIGALVGFDGGIRLVGKLVTAAKYVTPEKLVVPYLYLASNPGSLEDLYRQKQDLSDDLLAHLKYCDLYVVTLNPLVHYHFASQHLRFLSTKEPAVFPGEYSLDEIYEAYGWLARYTLAFLDATMKHDDRAMSFVTRKPQENGLPAHAVHLEINRAAGAPPTRTALAAQMHRQGFAHAHEIYAAMKAADHEFKLPAAEFGDWIDDLVSRERQQDALVIAKLFAEEYPDRPGPQFWLANIYTTLGKKTEAVQSLRKLLVIDPANDFVRKQLADLESGKRK